jgi:hypothetical protein
LRTATIAVIELVSIDVRMSLTMMASVLFTGDFDCKRYTMSTPEMTTSHELVCAEEIIKS